MPAAVSDTVLPRSAAGLDFSRTVDRSLLHRRNLTEVFLTDARALGADGFAAAALLPVAHPYYTSLACHDGRTADLVLLLECCRQAETYAAHVFHGVGRDASFVLRGWSAELCGRTARQAVPAAADPAGPVELSMTAVTSDAREHRGVVSGLTYDFALWVADDRLAAVRMEVGYLAPATYAVLRARGRQGPPPFSDEVAPSAGRPVDPALAGRVRAADTLLLDAVAAPGEVTAGLRVAADNPSLFDHPQDHVPGMVLVEAARQIAAFALREWTGADPGRSRLVAVESSFRAYAELDAATTLTATPADGGPPPAVRGDRAPDASPQERHAVEVTFRQGGAQVARMRVVMAPASKEAP